MPLAPEETKKLRRELEGEILEKIPENAFEELRPLHVEQYEEIREMDFATMKRIVEALLFVAHKPLAMSEIKKVVKGYKTAEIEEALGELKAEIDARGGSFRLQEIAGGYELSTHPQFAPWIMKLELEKRKKQATKSALETLAILAYKQPVTRVEIEEIRGVNVSGVLSTLLERNLIKIIGRKEIPGRPLLYGTSDKFLEHFRLKSLEELPKIDEIKDLVTRMVNKEEQAEEDIVAETSSEDISELVIPSQEERRRVLEEVSEVIQNTKVKVDIPANVS